MTSAAAGTELAESQVIRSSAYRELLIEKDRDTGRLLIKRGNRTSPRTDLCRTLRRIKRSNICDFDKPRKLACHIGKIEYSE